MQKIFKVKTDIQEDANNYWQACNRISHGVDWKKRAKPEVLNNVVGR